MTDRRIQQHVEDAIDWAEPSLDGSRIGVIVYRGVVTLRGLVETGSEKATAERVALLVRGVKGVVNDLAVRAVAGLEPVLTGVLAITSSILVDPLAVVQ